MQQVFQASIEEAKQQATLQTANLQVGTILSVNNRQKVNGCSSFFQGQISRLELSLYSNGRSETLCVVEEGPMQLRVAVDDAVSTSQSAVSMIPTCLAGEGQTSHGEYAW